MFIVYIYIFVEVYLNLFFSELLKLWFFDMIIPMFSLACHLSSSFRGPICTLCQAFKPRSPEGRGVFLHMSYTDHQCKFIYIEYMKYIYIYVCKNVSKSVNSIYRFYVMRIYTTIYTQHPSIHPVYPSTLGFQPPLYNHHCWTLRVEKSSNWAKKHSFNGGGSPGI